MFTNEVKSNHILRYSIIVTLFLMFLFGMVMQTFAQQTVFNVPTTNTLERGKTHLEMTTGFRTQTDNRSSFLLPRVTTGLGNELEVSTGVLNVQGGFLGDNTVVQLAGKWRFYNNEEKGTSFQVTSQLNIPVRVPSGVNTPIMPKEGLPNINNLTIMPVNSQEKASVLVFAGVHQKFNSLGTRLSGGFYNATPRALFEQNNVVGGWASVEQPIIKGVDFIADWMSGSHRLGVFTPGASVHFGKHNVKVGYQISNVDRSLDGWIMRYGVTF